ncbi:MAG: sulfatase [Verrucomicrobiae bacterium]|nr:sulfatase [Verrucomicrobiae bacterium]
MDGIATHWPTRSFHALFLLLSSLAAASASPRPNVLFIAIDDLRPELGCYGAPHARTPHIDALAARGVRFTRAYCQEAICGPSRASLMTGLRPDRAGVVDNETYFRDTVPAIVTLPEHFRRSGYETVYAGKIFHGRMTDDGRSWSRGATFPPGRAGMEYQRAENVELVKRRQQEAEAKYGPEARYGLGCGPATEDADAPDSAYMDGRIAEAAILTLRDIKGRPFFLGVGFHKPHLPFVAPKKYWDLYDPAEIPLGPNPDPPQNATSLARHSSFELRTRADIPKSGPVDEALARRLRHGYLACASFADAQIGKVLAELDRLGLRENTIVMLWGDHGWHLGDLGIWGKATNYEIAARAPLIVAAPSRKARGRAADGLVEFIDMYPTLCELAGLPLPPHLDGRSFAPLLDDPTRPGKAAAITQFPSPALREWAAMPLSPGMRETFFGPLIGAAESRLAVEFRDAWSRDRFERHVMGYAVRTDRHRMIRWVDVREPDSALASELYDHQTDPHETTNIAPDPASTQLLQELTRLIPQPPKPGTQP